MAPLAISPARLVALRAERDGRAQDLLAQNEQRAPYAPLGEEGRSDLVLAFDQPLGVGQTVALYLWTGNDEEDAATRAR
ncbi:MAG: hypothetical protein R3B72_51940 [Polyangiaceae bacterium]